MKNTERGNGSYNYLSVVWRNKIMKMSLVVPCYNEEEAIPIFYREALKVIEQLKDEFEFEFLLRG